jgi:hypothetical protein
MGGKIHARFLPEPEYDSWSKLVATSPEGSIYNTAEYLDVLSSVTDARFRVLVAENGEGIAGGVALYERKRPWGSFVSPRLLLYYNGLVLSPQRSKYPSERTARQIETLSVLEESLRNAGYGRMIFRNRSPFRDVRPFLARGWSAWTSYTYVVPIQDPSAAWGRVEQNLRRLVQRCIRDGMSVVDSDDFDSFFRMHRATNDRKRIGLYLSEAAFRTYFKRLKTANLCRLYQALSSDGRPIAAEIVLLGPHCTSHTVCAATEPEFLRTGVTALLRWKAFEELSKLGFSSNDLTDAALNPVTHFKSQLGGDLEPCFNLRAPEAVGFRVERSIAATRSAIRGIARRLGVRRPRHS